MRGRPKGRNHFEVWSPPPCTVPGPPMKNTRGNYENPISEFQLAQVINGEEVPEPRVILDSVLGECEADLQIVLLVGPGNLHGPKRHLDLYADPWSSFHVPTDLGITPLVIRSRCVHLDLAIARHKRSLQKGELTNGALLGRRQRHRVVTWLSRVHFAAAAATAIS